jgi:acetylornithine deacetylase/succinyl-diaminopimelate desuccinylase-like protein
LRWNEALGKRACAFLTVAAAAALVTQLCAQQTDQALAHDIFQQLVEIDTSHSGGSVDPAAEAARQRLLQAGFPASDISIEGPREGKLNLIVRLQGASPSRSILIFAHLDVVDAKRSDWSTDPFRFIEKDGYFYGRGTQDIKENVAIALATFIRLKREKFVPKRDIWLMLTADEEAGPDDGMDWLVQHKSELFRNFAFAINLDAGGVVLRNGQPLSVGFEATEKTYADFKLSASDPGGHSSLPHPGNPILRLAAALDRLQATPFPAKLNPVTRDFFTHQADSLEPQARRLAPAALAPDAAPQALEALANTGTFTNALMRSTCVPTRIDGGHANNALPQSATANINCRILPGDSPAEVERELVEKLADPQIVVRYCSSQGRCGNAPQAQTLMSVAEDAPALNALRSVSGKLWPGIPVHPEMETGMSDSVYTLGAGLATYGISGVGIDEDDDRSHGRDERLRSAAFYEGLTFFYEFVRELDSLPPAQDMAK